MKIYPKQKNENVFMAWDPVSGKKNIIVYKNHLNQFKQAQINYNIIRDIQVHKLLFVDIFMLKIAAFWALKIAFYKNDLVT